MTIKMPHKSGILWRNTYHNTYSKTDVLLCIDAFETFRNMFLENYKLYHGDIILKRSHNSLFLYAKILYKLAGL